MTKNMRIVPRCFAAATLASLIVLGGAGVVGAQTPAPAEAPKPDAAKPDAANPDADAAKKPTRAELGEMLKKCSEEADAKGLTVQKGKAEARKAYRRSCMLKNGVAPKKK